MYDKFDYDKIPAHTMSALDSYLIDGIPPGGFLTAVLENDLLRACSRADDHNLPVIPIIVMYLYNQCPAGCFGRPGVVEEYCKTVRKEKLAKEG